MLQRVLRLSHPPINHSYSTRRLCTQLQQQKQSIAKSKKLCFVFPGMGAQYVGMCKDLATEFKYIDTFLKDVDDYLAPFNEGRALTDLMWNSDKKTLSNVIIGCHSTLIHSLCLWKILETEYDINSVFHHEHDVVDVAIMGHSLGEMTAMFSAGLFKSVEDGLWIQQRFGDIMLNLHREGPSDTIMCAVVSDPKNVEMNVLNMMTHFDRVCMECNVSIANINTPTQLVFSGRKRDIERVIKEMNSDQFYGGKLRHRYLDIDGAYHSHYMRDGKEEYDACWRELDLNEKLKCDVYLNGLGNRYNGGNSNDIWPLLAGQLYGRVHWHDCVMNYIENTGGNDEGKSKEDFEYVFIEVGPRKVITKLIEQITKYWGHDTRHAVRTMNIENAKTIPLIESVL